MQDLKDVTNDTHYENFRANKLQSGGRVRFSLIITKQLEQKFRGSIFWPKIPHFSPTFSSSHPRFLVLRNRKLLFLPRFRIFATKNLYNKLQIVALY